MLSIRTNVSSMNAQKSLSQSSSMLESSMAKLSSGMRITRASDDAAGLGVSANLSAQVRSYNQAQRNAGDGMSVVQTAEGALNEVSSILTRLRELTMQSSSDGISNTERAFVQEESDALIDELDRIDATTEFNGTNIFGAATALTFQVGIRATAEDFITLDTSAMEVDAASLTNGTDTISDLLAGGTHALNVSATQSRTALSVIDGAINQVSGFRSELDDEKRHHRCRQGRQTHAEVFPAPCPEPLGDERPREQLEEKKQRIRIADTNHRRDGDAEKPSPTAQLKATARRHQAAG